MWKYWITKTGKNLSCDTDSFLTLKLNVKDFTQNFTNTIYNFRDLTLSFINYRAYKLNKQFICSKEEENISILY